MTPPQTNVGSRRATNVSINSNLLTEAKSLKINISRAAEQGLEQVLAARRAELWLEQNRAALESSNAYVEQHGLPLARHRRF